MKILSKLTLQKYNQKHKGKDAGGELQAVHRLFSLKALLGGNGCFLSVQLAVGRLETLGPGGSAAAGWQWQAS